MPTDLKTGQPIYAGAPSVGLRNVGSYQVSGEPWITGSTTHAAGKVRRYQFPFVTRELSVALTTPSDANKNLWIHFASGSSHDFSDAEENTLVGLSDVYRGNHYVALSSGSQSVTFRAKVKEIYIATPHHNSSNTMDYRILADLTNVPTKRMYHLTGSGHTEAASDGVS
jgi:hypothetical protein